MAPVQEPSPLPPLSTDAVMDEVLDQVRADLRARLVSRGATDDFADARVFEDVYGLFRQGLAHDSQHVLLLPDLLTDEWRPELALRLTSHRSGPIAWLVLFAKRRVLLPLMRWLLDHSLENFRRQDRLNVVLMACLQSLAADHARLRLRVAALEAGDGRAGGSAAPGAGPSGR